MNKTISKGATTIVDNKIIMIGTPANNLPIYGVLTSSGDYLVTQAGDYIVWG